MSEARFTPGPWSVPSPYSGFSQITGADGRLVFGLAAGGPTECRSEAECEANARLIAAAPDMYEALRGLVAMLRAADKYPDLPDPEPLKAAVAALSKAEQDDD